MLGVLPGIPETGFDRHRFTACIEGLASNVGGSGPMRDQTEHPEQSFALGHGLVTDIGFSGPTNESGRVSWPDLILDWLSGRFDAKMAQKALALLDGLTMATHSIMVIDVLAPQSVVKSGRFAGGQSDRRALQSV